MSLIDKDALKVEIEKEIKDIYAGREYVGIPSWEEREIDGLEKAIEILNTLEVKGVDLEKEITLWANANPEIRLDDVERLAKHFFELGIKVSRMTAVLDSGIAEEFILDLKRLENDYKRLMKKIQKGE
jgi:predicted nucleotidyltransferase